MQDRVYSVRIPIPMGEDHDKMSAIDRKKLKQHLKNEMGKFIFSRTHYDETYYFPNGQEDEE